MAITWRRRLPIKAHQIAGALLEEAVLAILACAGFATLESLNGDPTINPDGPPVTIYGRGSAHQIDAVADPLVAYPFSNPARLLVEAKAYDPKRRVGLDIVRNAVGTVKDLMEFWRPAGDAVRLTRYHYRYAIFASTEFTEPAQQYAHAQDVYLLPLRRSAFFRPVIGAIDTLREYWKADENDWPEDRKLSDYRSAARNALRGYVTPEYQELDLLRRAVQQVSVGLIAVAGRQFPLFLIPRNPALLSDLQPVERIRIYWDDNGWYIRRKDSNEDIFSFDLPDELFAIYAEDGVLQREEALRMKADRLGAIQAFFVRGDETRFIQFELDPDWITRLLQSRADVRREPPDSNTE